MGRMAVFVLAAGLATVTASAAGAGNREAEPAAEKKICKKADTPIGSRLGARRICATKKEWQAYVDPSKRETRMNFEMIQKRGLKGE